MVTECFQKIFFNIKNASEQQIEWIIWQSEAQIEGHTQHYHQQKYKWGNFYISYLGVKSLHLN